VLVIEERMTKARTTSPLTRNQKKKMSEIPSEVKLQKIVPEVPRDETERGELLEDLQVMGYSGLLEKPWGFKDDRIVRSYSTGCLTSSITQSGGKQFAGRKNAGGKFTISAKAEADWRAGRTSTSRNASKTCPIRRTDTQSMIARIRGTGDCSPSSFQSCIRRSPTGSLLPGVTRFLAR
jgi:hypothetical protein